MLKREDRQRKVAEWLEHLQGWKASGESLAAYARRCSLPLWAAYHWRAVLTGEGSWHEGPNEPVAVGIAQSSARRVPLRFARVAVSDTPRAMPLIVRVQLGNGRRAEIEIGHVDQLGEVLELLERPA
jgi:hypothetical protein